MNKEPMEDIEKRKFRVIRVKKWGSIPKNSDRKGILIRIMKDGWSRDNYKKYFWMYKGRLEEYLLKNEWMETNETIDIYFDLVTDDSTEYIEIALEVSKIEVIGEF